MSRLAHRADTLASYEAGVSAVVRVSAGLSDWDRSACGIWSAADTARHLLAVAKWYHSWLDRAVAGNTERPFHASEIDVHNQSEVQALSHVPGPDAVELFAAEARRYASRAANHWGLPFAYPYGVSTVGHHLSVAAAEWHLHAHDLSLATSVRYVPDDPVMLFRVAGTGWAAATGGLRGTITSWLIPVAAQRRPWAALLARTGR